MNIFMDASFLLTFFIQIWRIFNLSFFPDLGIESYLSNTLCVFCCSSLFLLLVLFVFITFSAPHYLSFFLFTSFPVPVLCLPACLLSVFSSPAASPELPPRYLLGQGQRPNTITHVCWYRNQNLSLNDYLRMNQVPMRIWRPSQNIKLKWSLII